MSAISSEITVPSSQLTNNTSFLNTPNGTHDLGESTNVFHVNEPIDNFPELHRCICPADDKWKSILFSPEVENACIDAFASVVQPLVRGTSFHGPTFWQAPRSKFTVWAYCCWAASYSNHPAILSYITEFNLTPLHVGDVYFQAASALLPDIEKQTSFDHCRALSFLGKYASTSIGHVYGRRYYQMAIKMAVDLRLHVDPDVEAVHGVLPWVEKEERRRWWKGFATQVSWQAEASFKGLELNNIEGLRDRDYVNDAVFLSVRTRMGLPDFAALPLMKEKDAGLFILEATEFFLTGIRLCGTICKTASNAHRLDDVMKETVEEIDLLASQRLEAGEEATRWMVSQPEWFRDLSAFPGDDPTRTDRFEPWNLLSVHIFYHGAQLVLHFPEMLKSHPSRFPHPFESLPASDLFQPSPATPTDYTICIQHARIIADLCRRMGPIEFPGGWLVWPIQYACFVLIIDVKDAIMAFDKDRVAKGRADLDACFSVLDAVAKRSLMAGYMRGNLAAVVAEDLDDWENDLGALCEFGAGDELGFGTVNRAGMESGVSVAGGFGVMGDALGNDPWLGIGELGET
ncbi:hypothetical protein HK104_000387 [Borealophlyctis nickersoniae]|nr:hypothetical protein HK104_000387 [Borealophlyctis nickersoniae]